MKPLVVGSPRSGFALLCSVLAHVNAMQPRPVDARLRLLRTVASGFSLYVSQAVTGVFEEAGLTGELIFNQNFRQLLGGPKWLHETKPDTACVRKYIGARGHGDFTLIINHPRLVLECDDIIHSHVNPTRWLTEPAFADFDKFASVRNPIGIVNSSLFSINALTSEYMQHFVPPKLDNHALREDLALYKFTDLDFFNGIVSFYKRYFEEFLEVMDGYILMRWEDLISKPAKTIAALARAVDLPVDEQYAAEIWQRLDHVNLTGAHKHNFRKGGGRVGDWRNWMTNHHLQIMAETGFGSIIERLGYPPLEDLDTATYNPFQQQVAAAVADGRVIDRTTDRDLFGFAFNKSNLDSEKFPFKRYDERTHTRVERSSFTDERLMYRAWDAAEHAAGEINQLFEAVIAGDYSSDEAIRSSLISIEAAIAAMSTRMPKAAEAVLAEVRQIAARLTSPSHSSLGKAGEQPYLIRSVGSNNIVSYAGRFYLIPQALGPIDLTTQDVENLPGVIADTNYLALWKTASGGELLTTPSPEEAPLCNLNFVTITSDEDWLAQARRLRLFGAETIGVRPLTSATRPLVEKLAAEVEGIVVAPDPRNETEAKGQLRIADNGDTDAVIILDQNGDALSTALLDYLDRPASRIVAAVTDRYWQKHPLYLISIPKAGTHLLFRLAAALGYSEGGIAPDTPSAGHWYYLLHSNAHTPAPAFFIDEVLRAPFGNRAHPFTRAPALFNYRNPFDILVSEANYYHKDGKTAFAGYLDALSYQQRLLRLTDDPWLLGSIRDRVGMFAAWLDCANVIPASFEELVGAAGGGSDDARQRLVWSIQLKLHIPGNPDDIVDKFSDRTSPTFRSGRLGGYKENISPEVRAKIEALGDDFLQVYGYGGFDTDPGLPARCEEFRLRPLRLSKAQDFLTPYVVGPAYLDHNIVAYKGRYYAIDRAIGAFDITAKSEQDLELFPQANDVETVKALVLQRKIKLENPFHAIPRALGKAKPRSSVWSRGLNRLRRMANRMRNGRGRKG